MATMTVRNILEAATLPQGRLRLGSLLADISRQAMRIDPESSPGPCTRPTSSDS